MFLIMKFKIKISTLIHEYTNRKRDFHKNINNNSYNIFDGIENKFHMCKTHRNNYINLLAIFYDKKTNY